MSNPRITYTSRPDSARDAELNVLSNVYAFILRCGEARRAEEMKKGTRPGAPDAEERFKNDSSAKLSIHDE